MPIEVDWTQEPMTPEEASREALIDTFRFLSREFLTWLVYHADVDGGVFEGFEISVGGKLILRAPGGTVTDVTIKGPCPSLSPDLRYSLAGGLSVKEVELTLSKGERSFSFALAAENFDLKRVKLPELLAEESDDRLMERLTLLGELDACLRTAYGEFLKLRGDGWSETVVPAMKEWLREGSQIDAR